MLEATCDATGKVTALGVVVDVAVVISEGKQASSGVLILDGAIAYYIASSATDIKTTIEKIVAVIDDLNASLNQIVTVITSVGAGMTGPTTAPPPTLAVDLAVLTGKVTTLTATKTALNNLKGALK
jgi:hypothetical protein